MHSESQRKAGEINALTELSGSKDVAVADCQAALVEAQSTMAQVRAFALDICSLIKMVNLLVLRNKPDAEQSLGEVEGKIYIETGNQAQDVMLCRHCVQCDVTKAANAVAPLCQQVASVKPGVEERLFEWIDHFGGTVPAWMAGGWCQAISEELRADASRLCHSEDERTCLEALERQLLQTKAELQLVLEPAMSPGSRSPRHSSPNTPTSALRKRQQTPRTAPGTPGRSAGINTTRSTTPSSMRTRGLGDHVEQALYSPTSRGRGLNRTPERERYRDPDAQIVRVAGLLRAELDRQRCNLAQQVSIFTHAMGSSSSTALDWVSQGPNPLASLARRWHALKLAKLATDIQSHESTPHAQVCVEHSEKHRLLS